MAIMHGMSTLEYVMYRVTAIILVLKCSFVFQVIFCIFLRIIKLLLSKLKADQLRFTDYRYRLVCVTELSKTKWSLLFIIYYSLLHRVSDYCFLFPLYSLARATLVLIPLLGIHEILFMILIDETIEGSPRYVRNFINLTLSSFQVITWGFSLSARPKYLRKSSLSVIKLIREFLSLGILGCCSVLFCQRRGKSVELIFRISAVLANSSL